MFTAEFKLNTKAMTKIPFNVSARTARLIGRENVSNAEGAIIELVKNGYDADASVVVVVFENNALYIIDNGDGMTEEVIRNSWMTIGTDNKEISPFTKTKRIKAGAKGIGRFALDRLGKKAEVRTLPRGESSGFLWSVNWSSFEKQDTAISEVTANLEEMPQISLENFMPEILLSKSNFKDFNFSQGTVLKISELRDEWNKESIENILKGLESLAPPMENTDFSIFLLSELLPDSDRVRPLVCDNYDWQVTAKYNQTNQFISFEIRRNELDIDLLEKNHSDIFLNSKFKKEPYDLTTFKRGYFEKKISIKDLLKGFEDSEKLLATIGDFQFNFSFLKNQTPSSSNRQMYPYKSTDYKSRKEWLQRFGGVRIFRDNFRVRPYGENGEDWLKLGERQAQSPAGAGQSLGGYRIRPNQIVGDVHISRIENSIFKDKAGREGIQENASFALFKQVLLGIISIFEKDRNLIFYTLSELHKKKNERERLKAKASEAKKILKGKIKDEANSPSLFGEDKEKNSAIETLIEASKMHEEEINEKTLENKILRSLASSGLITAASAHELKALSQVLETRADELYKLMSEFIKEDDLKDVPDAYNPFILLSQIEESDKDLHEWLNYALTPLKKDRRTTNKIYFDDYFHELEKMWSRLLEQRLINLKITNNTKGEPTIKTFKIDLDTIFSNLIMNSIESFNRKKKKEPRAIEISYKDSEGFLEILYSDNGVGLSNCYKEAPEDIFIPQETTKIDSKGSQTGTGMGMYLVKSSVDDNHGKIKILEPKEGFSVLIKLPILSKK